MDGIVVVGSGLEWRWSLVVRCLVTAWSLSAGRSMLDGGGARRRPPDCFVPFERQHPGQSFAVSKNWFSPRGQRDPSVKIQKTM